MHLRARSAKFKVIAVTAVATMALASCGGNSPKADSGSGGGDSPVTLAFAASTFGDPGRGPGLRKWIDKYNASQKGVVVKPAVVPYPTFGTTILTQMGAGEGPDLVRFDMPEFAAAAGAGLIEPLNTAIDAAKYNLNAAPDKFMFVGDKRYAVIFEASNYVLYYNTDLVSTPPTSFDEFLATAKAATSKGVYGAAFRQTAPEQNGMWQDIWNYVYGFGGSYSDGKNLTLNSPKVVEGLSAYKKVYDAGVIPKGADAATFRAMFNQGKVAMEIDNGGFVAAVRGANASLPFSVAPVPFPVRSQGAILAPIVVNAASKHKEAATSFLQWMLKPESQKDLQLVLGASSVASVTERSPAELAKSPFLPVVDKLTDTSLPQVVLGYEAKTPDIRKIVIEQVIRALAGEVDMQAAMDAAQQKAASVVK